MDIRVSELFISMTIALFMLYVEGCSAFETYNGE
jgi:hypothetical protein